MWFELYYGSGIADPTAARAASGMMGVDGRTAFAMEVVRQHGAGGDAQALVQRVADIWSGKTAPPRSEPLAQPCWTGRNTKPLGMAALKDARRTNLPHYGMRFIGKSEAEDLEIATIEAIYFAPESSHQSFQPWLRDPRPRVRATAAHLLLLLLPPATPLPIALAAATSDWSPNRVAIQHRGHEWPLWRGPGNGSDCP
jgi:hypothetical protein